MAIRKVSAGQIWQPKADELNLIADVVNANAGKVLEMNAAAGKAVRLCWFKHGVTAWSGGSPPALAEWEVVAGDVVIYRQSVSPEEFRRRTIVTARRPANVFETSSGIYTDHNHPIVSLQPLAYGKIGLGVMSGLTPVKTRVVDLAHQCVAHDMEISGGTYYNRYLQFKTASHGYRIVASDIAQMAVADTFYPVVDLSHPIGLSYQAHDATGDSTFVSGGGGDSSWRSLNPWAGVMEDAGELINSSSAGVISQPGRYRIMYSAEFACTHTTYLGDVIHIRLRTNLVNDPGVRRTVQLHPESAGSGVAYETLVGFVSQEILDTDTADHTVDLQARVDYAVGSPTVGTTVGISDIRILIEKVA